MFQKILDANRLIHQWQGNRPRDIASARRLARALIERQGADAIVTPVAIEFVGGTRDKSELELSRIFLAEFRIVDQGRILPKDFVEARRFAEHIPHAFRPRGFADCLIRAIAVRLNYEIDTADTGMPRHLPPSSGSGPRLTRKRQKRRG